MLIVDTNDLRHQFMFFNIKTNSNIPNSFFEFKPPAGARKVKGLQ
jgi:outer membrane lipoprotein-sorting protein